MEKLAIFKIIDDVPTLCGYYDKKEDAIEYLLSPSHTKPSQDARP